MRPRAKGGRRREHSEETNKESRKEVRCYGYPHTVLAVGIRIDVRPLGKDSGSRKSEPDDSRWKGPKGRPENGTSVPRERVWSESPSRHGENDGPKEGQRYEGPRRNLHTGSRDSDGRPKSRRET